MTKRVCVFGNSHLAALREAQRKFSDRWDNVHFDMIGAHEDLLLETEVANGVITPTSEAAREAFDRLGGVSNVDLNTYDAVVMVGGQVAVSRAGFLYRHMRWPRLPSQRTTPYQISDPYSLVSESAFTTILRDVLAKSLGGAFAKRLRDATDKPVFMASQPRTSTGVQDVEKHSLSILNDAVAVGDAAVLSTIFDRTATQLFDSMGITFLAQPRKTIVNDVITQPAFINGAVRLTFQGRYPQPKNDLIHANATYGATVLDQLAEAVA